MQLQNDVTPARLFSAFGLITGLLPSRFRIDDAPKKFTIEGATEKVVLDLLESQTTTYEFTLLQNKTENNIRPIEQVKYLETYKTILRNALPEVVPYFNIFKKSYEIISFKQQFSFDPIIMKVTLDTVFLNMSIKRNGTLYGIVMEKKSTVPNARQMKYGLSSSNFNLDTRFWISLTFVYPTSNRGQYFISKIANFSNLFDNTDYEAYFIAENDLPINPDLMNDDQIKKISFRTESEIFIIPETYKASFIEKIKIPLIILGLFFMALLLI